MDFAQRALTFNGTNEFEEKMMPKVIKDIGTSPLKINETLLENVRKKLLEKGYLETMLYVAQNTASVERDEFHRILTICSYHKVPPSVAVEILEELNVISQPITKKASIDAEIWTKQTRSPSASFLRSS